MSCRNGLEGTGQCCQLIVKGAGHTLVPFVVGVQTVGVAVLEILNVLVHHGVEAADRIHVDDGDGPDVTGILDGLDVLFKIDATLVGVVLGDLPVSLATVELGSVDRRQKYNLLIGIHALHLVQCHVDAAAVRVVIHLHIAPLSINKLFGLAAMGVLHLFGFLLIPIADGHTLVVVVGTDKDEDGIDRVSMFGIQTVGLTGDVVPLASADSIDVGGDAQPLLQEVPVFLFLAVILRVGNRVTKVGHALLHPRMRKCRLSIDGSAKQSRQCQKQ